MPELKALLNKPKSRRVAAIAALSGAITPMPIAGVHKFYLGQPMWGIIYLLLSTTPIPRIACAIEAVWYLLEDQEQFNRQFNRVRAASGAREISSVSGPAEPLGYFEPAKVGAIAEALRQIDQLRADGLMSEYEFEQKRRQLLDRIA